MVQFLFEFSIMLPKYPPSQIEGRSTVSIGASLKANTPCRIGFSTTPISDNSHQQNFPLDSFPRNNSQPENLKRIVILGQFPH